MKFMKSAGIFSYPLHKKLQKSKLGSENRNFRIFVHYKCVEVAPSSRDLSGTEYPGLEKSQRDVEFFTNFHTNASNRRSFGCPVWSIHQKTASTDGLQRAVTLRPEVGWTKTRYSRASTRSNSFIFGDIRDIWASWRCLQYGWSWSNLSQSIFTSPQ